MALKLQQLTCEIMYRPGQLNDYADGLSRQEWPMKGEDYLQAEDPNLCMDSTERDSPPWTEDILTLFEVLSSAASSRTWVCHQRLHLSTEECGGIRWDSLHHLVWVGLTTPPHLGGTHYTTSSGWDSLHHLVWVGLTTPPRLGGTHYTTSSGWDSLHHLVWVGLTTPPRLGGTHYTISSGWDSLHHLVWVGLTTPPRLGGTHYTISSGWD